MPRLLSCLCLILAMLAASAAHAATDAWRNGAAMLTERAYQSATVLPDGDVLVAGGANQATYLSSAERYHPASNTWTATGSMAQARLGHTATLLLSGQVLVTGGMVNATDLAGAELYDPATGLWSTAAHQPVPRLAHTATLLGDGRVLVAGGLNDSRTPVPVAEVYDPTTGLWTNTGPMVTPREMHTATLLPNGKVLVAGGNDATSRLQSAELYDPATNTWTAAASMTAVRGNGHTATLLASAEGGKVLVAGGNDGNFVATAELYDPVADTWTAVASMNTPRALHNAALLPDGQVLVAGGSENGVGAHYLASTERYNPATNTWTATVGSLATPRQGSAATLLPSGQVLVSGGQDDTSVFDSTELFDPASGAWSAAGTSVSGNVAKASLLPSGKVLAVSDVDTQPRLYDPAANTWSNAASISTARLLPTLTLLPSGKLLVAGGRGSAANFTSAEVYDEATDTWTATSAIPSEHGSAAAVLLRSGQALVMGGNTAGGTTTNAVDLYDPATNAWTASAPMLTQRSYFGATLLHDGRVLVAGGQTGSGYIAAAELYDPAANTWTATGPLATARSGHTVTLLPSGKVLVAGGWANIAGDTRASVLDAELYDPGTGTWSSAGTLPAGAGGENATATLLPSGQVLLTGGDHFSGGTTVHAAAVLYDPIANTWSSAPSMATARSQHASVLLATGQVLVAGGLNTSGYVAAAERYDPGLAPAPVRQPSLLAPGTFLLQGATGTLAATSSGSATDASGAVTQTGFRPRLEASGGASGGNGASNAPVLQVQRIDNGQMRFITPDASQPPSDTLFTASATAMNGFPEGPVLVRAWVNGVPSAAQTARLFAKATPALALAALPASPSTAGQSVTFTATLTGGVGPTGAVTFTDGATPLCTVAAAPYTCAATLAVGAHTVTAVYAGDANNDGTSTALPHQVNKAQPTLGLSASPSPSTWGQSVTITATLAGGYSPTGQVTISDDNGVLCTVAAAPYTCTTAAMATGARTLSAAYAGDANNDPASKNAAHTVNPAAQAITAFAAVPAAPVFTPGGMFTVSATGGASGNPVIFSSLDALVCTVAPGTGTVTMLMAGSCPIAADQAGNANYNAAPRLVRAIALAAAAPGAATAVPTLSPWALAVLAVLLGWAGIASGKWASSAYLSSARSYKMGS